MTKGPFKKNICVVGGGNWGKNHIKTLNSLDELAAVVEPNEDLISFFSKTYPSIKIYKSLDEALKDKSLEGFVIATPAETHFEISKKLLLQNKKILVEKPFTLNIDNAKDLLSIEKDSMGDIMVGHVMLFHPAIKKLKEIIEIGEIGNIEYIYSNRLNFGKVRSAENVFWSFAPHDISILQYLIDDYPDSIQSKGSSFIRKGIFDTVVTFLEYPNNIRAHIFNSWIHPFKEHKIVIKCKNGMLSFEDSKQEKPLKYYNKKFVLDGSKTLIKNGTHKKEIHFEGVEPLKEELLCFIKLVNHNQIPTANSQHAYNVTKIMVEANNQLESLR